MAQRTNSNAALPQIKPAELRKFHAALDTWYKAHGRHDLPWRQTDDPYRIWLSEVMLQQTQVATVLARFYHPFLAKFPTVEALAAAPREAVMKAWEGLGYYRRAGNLHEAAKKVVSLQSPVFSKNVKTLMTDDWRLATLLSLPGIGRNTAHAIAAFAYHQPVAILEANVKRVVARILALEAPSEKALWAGTEALLNSDAPFDYNQAMMDLGSLICTPKHPRCDACPARSICRGKAAPELYPAPKAKKRVPTREVIILVREDANGRLFLAARDAALLGGLYGFPQINRQSPVASHQQKRSTETLLATDDWRLATPLGTVTHVYSHFKLIGTVMHERVPAATNSPDWYSREQIAVLPLSALDHKVLALVENSHTGKKKPRKRSGLRQPD